VVSEQPRTVKFVKCLIRFDNIPFPFIKRVN